jgi:hypothetical protein
VPSATLEEESAAVSKKLLDEELFFEVISLLDGLFKSIASVKNFNL